MSWWQAPLTILLALCICAGVVGLFALTLEVLIYTLVHYTWQTIVVVSSMLIALWGTWQVNKRINEADEA